MTKDIRDSVAGKLRKYFLAGLLIVLPLVLTIYIFWTVFSWTEGLVAKFLAGLFPVRIPGLGILLVLTVITFTGMITANFFGKRLYLFFESVIKKIPLFNRVYKVIQEISYASLGQSSGLFKRVVLIEYPREGLYTLAFVTRDTHESIAGGLPEECYNVFVPTAPNPTSGVIIIIPKSKVISLPLTVEEAFKLIVSGGAFSPREKNGHQKD